MFDLIESSSLSAWNFSVLFNTDNLAFVSREEVAPAGFGFFESDSSNVVDLQNGLLNQVGFDTGAGPTAAFGPFRVASDIR